MRIYDKRIGFLVSYQTLIPHGGIGQFAKSFCDLMDRHNVKVDIITDKAPQDTNVDFIKSLKANIIYPEETLRYTEHSGIFMYGDTFCYERMANFRNSIIKALTNNIYDAFICNTYETVQVASTMGLEDCIQIIAYTHLESQIFKDTKNPFLHNTNELMRQQLQTNGIYVGTQSKFNQLNMNIDAYYLPIPLTEISLLNECYQPREGILFIGRWEEGKNPELFCDLIEMTQLPAKVMTNANGAKKFKERFDKMGANYIIKESIIGEEKVNFIKGSKLAFNPSTVESYGMAFYEQIIQLPTFCLDNQRWTKNFQNFVFFETTKKQMAQDVQGAYLKFQTSKEWYSIGNLEKAKFLEEQAFHEWNHCFNEFKGKQSSSNTAKILNFSTTKYSEYIEYLGRNLICIDDVRSVLTNKHKFRLIYTDNDTYLTKDPLFEPLDENQDNLFEFL